jgi:hypothetical protein
MKDMKFRNNEMIGYFIICIFCFLFYIIWALLLTYNGISDVLEYIFLSVGLLLPIFGVAFFIGFNLFGYLYYEIKNNNLFLNNKYIFLKKEINIDLHRVNRVIVTGPDGETDSTVIPNIKGGRWISILTDDKGVYFYAPYQLYNELKNQLPLDFEFIIGQNVESLTKEYNSSKRI